MAEGIVIKESDVSVPDVYGWVGKSAEENMKKVDTFDASILRTTAHLKSLLSVADTTSQAGLTQLFQVNEKVNLTTKEAIELEKQKIQLDKLRSQAAAAASRQRQTEAREIDANTKAIQKQAVAQEKANSAYDRTQKKLTALNKEHRDLAIRRELGVKLTDKEIKRLEFLEKRITRYDGALKAVDATQGKHQRNVGNYASAFNGLGNSVQQLTRELPAFANSMQTGFMAISNNLPIFFDEVKKIRVANQQLTASGLPTVSVFKQVAQSIFSVTGLLGLAVTGITVLGPKLGEWFASMSSNNKVLEERRAKQKAANEEIKKAADYVGQESHEYVSYLIRLRQTNAGSKERSKLISEISSKYGRTLKNLKDEKDFMAQINNEIKNYITYQRARFEIDKNLDLINRNLSKQDELRSKTARQLGISAKQLDLFAESVRLAMEKEQEAIANGTLGIDKFIEKNDELERRKFTDSRQETLENYVNELGRASQRLEYYNFNIQELTGVVDGLGFGIVKNTETVQKNTNALDANNNALAEQFERYNSILSLLQEIKDLNVAESLLPMEVEITNEMVRLFEQIRTEGEFNVDQLETYIGQSYDTRRKMARDNARFQIQELKNTISQEKILEEERLRNERDKLLEAVNVSKVSEAQKAKDREAIELSYQSRLKDLFGIQLEEYKIFALQREKIELELRKTIYGLDQEQADKLNEVNNQLNDALEARTEKTNAKVATEFEKQEEVARKRFRLRLMYQNKSDEEIAKATLQNDIEMLSQKLALEAAAGHDTLDLEIELAEKKRQLADKEAAEDKKRAKDTKDFTKAMINEAFKFEIEASKEREKLIDKEIADNQRLADSLRQQAAQGNADAKESLAELDETIDQKNELKKKEQQEQQFLDELKLLYDATQNYVDKGDSVPVAATKAFAQVEGLKAIFSKIKGFVAGTKRTVGEELPALFPGVDGHLVRVDGREKILNPELSAETGNATTDEIVAGYKLARSMSMGAIAPSVNYRQGMHMESEVASAIKELTKITKAKPDRVLSVELENQIAKAVLSTERTATRTVRTRHNSSRR